MRHADSIDAWPIERTPGSLRRASEALRVAILEHTAALVEPVAISAPPKRVRFECERCHRRGVAEVRGGSVYEAVKRAHRLITRSTCRFQALEVFISPIPPPLLPLGR